MGKEAGKVRWLGKEGAELITGVVRARPRGHRCASITTKGHSPDTR